MITPSGSPATPLPSSTPFNVTTSQIIIQVGDRYHGIPREAIEKHKDSLFGEILSQMEKSLPSSASPAQQQVICIQRNPAYFPLIVGFLTSGLDSPSLKRLKEESDLSIVEQILEDALFYRLPSLVSYLKALLKPELSREVVAHLLSRHTSPRDFSGARLVGLDLSKLNFIELEIKGKDSKYLPTTIHRCEFKPDFSGSNLQWTNFDDSVLTGSNFSKANMSFTQMKRSNLSLCNFDETRVIKANLSQAIFQGSSFKKILLNEANFTKATFTEMDFQNVDVSTPFLTLQQPTSKKSMGSPNPTEPSKGCNFEGAKFIRCNLSLSCFRGCNLQGARFENCDLEGADFSGIDAQEIEFINCNLTRTLISHGDLRNCTIRNCNLSGAILNHAQLNFSKLFGSNFEEAQLVGCNLQCSELFEFSLDEPETKIVYKNHASFERATFRFALLQGVDMHQVNCKGADFRDANLTNAVMKETQLEGANLDGAVLKRRIIDEFDSNWVIFKKSKPMHEAGKN